MGPHRLSPQETPRPGRDLPLQGTWRARSPSVRLRRDPWGGRTSLGTGRLVGGGARKGQDPSVAPDSSAKE